MSSAGETEPQATEQVVGEGPILKNCRVCGVRFRTKTARAVTCPTHRVRRYARDLQTHVTAVTAERMVTAEDALLRGYSPERTTTLLAKEWNLAPALVRRDYVDPVLKLWSATASATDRESRRDRLRALFADGYRRAATKRATRKRRQVIPGKDGKPTIVETTEDVDAPDFKAMASFGKLLMDLDGLGTVNVNATHAHVIATAMAQVVARRKARDAGKPLVPEAIVEARIANGDPLDAELVTRGVLPRPKNDDA